MRMSQMTVHQYSWVIYNTDTLQFYPMLEMLHISHPSLGEQNTGEWYLYQSQGVHIHHLYCQHQGWLYIRNFLQICYLIPLIFTFLRHKSRPSWHGEMIWERKKFWAWHHSWKHKCSLFPWWEIQRQRKLHVMEVCTTSMKWVPCLQSEHITNTSPWHYID